MNTSMLAASEAVFTLYCQPCSSEGKHREADGYCDDCEEHLCSTCFKYHLLPKPMRHHRLRDRSKMPRQMKGKPDRNLALCTDVCQSHPNKMIEYFCKKHNQLGCSVCTTLHHRGCDKIDYIPDVADKVIDSEELKDLRFRLDLLCNTVNRIKVLCENNKIAAERYRKKVKAEIRKLTQDFTSFMTKLENDVNGKIDLITDQDTKLMNESAEECNAAADEAQDLIKELERREQNVQNCQLFVVMKKAEEAVKELEQRTTPMYLKTRVSRYHFTPDAKLQENLTASTRIGTVTVWKNSDMKAVHIQNIDVNIPADADKRKALITGGVLLNDNYLAICNSDSLAVELIDVGQNEMSSAVAMTSPPKCITEVNDGQVIVTLPEESKLHFLSVVGDKLKDTVHDICVDGQCYGVISTQHHLIVSFLESFKIEILDMNGTLVRRFVYSDRDSQGKNDFTFLSISPCQDIIYVSIPGNNKVVSLTLDGRVMNTYTDGGLRGPAGVTTDMYGNLIVCGSYSNNVYVLTSDLNKIQLLLEGSEVKGPCVVCTNKSSDKLFIYMARLRKINVYKLEI